MSLPKHFVRDNLAKAEGTSLYGIPIEEMSREELIACVFAGWDAYRQVLEQKTKEINHIFDILK